jgi:hypothetical protein
VIPVLKEIALFYEDYACDKGPDGRVLFYPSFSPEDITPFSYYMPTDVYATIPPTASFIGCFRRSDSRMWRKPYKTYPL